jgi:hypothetical protein
VHHSQSGQTQVSQYPQTTLEESRHSVVGAPKQDRPEPTDSHPPKGESRHQTHESDKSDKQGEGHPKSSFEKRQGEQHQQDHVREERLSNKEDRGSKLEHSETKSFDQRQKEQKQEDATREKRLSGTEDSSSKEIGKLASGDSDASPERNLLDSRRHNHESGKQYADRQKVASEYRAASYEHKKEILAAYTASTLGDSYLPILLNRADGRQKTVGHFLSAANLHATKGLRKDISEYYDPGTHPFKVHVFRKDDTESSTLQAGVVYYSHLYKTVDPTDKVVIDGLLSRPSDINPAAQDLEEGQGTALKNNLNGGNPPTSSPTEFSGTDTNATVTPTAGGGGGSQTGTLSSHAETLGWIDLISTGDDYVWLELTITSGRVSAAKIRTNGMAEGSSTYDPTATPGDDDSIVEFDGSSQKKSRVILAKITEGVVEQYVTTSLFLTTVDIGGKSAIYACPSIGSGGTQRAALPWDIDLKGVGTPDPETGEYSSYTATVNPGTLNGILPSNWDEEFSVSGSSIYYAIAVIQTDGTAINAVSIEIRTTAPSLQVPAIWATPTAVEYLFGLIKDGSAKRVIGAGSISLIPKVWLTVEKDEPVGPGELAYNRYYILG